MVFNRKVEPAKAPAEMSAPQLRRNDRASAAHISQVAGVGMNPDSVIGSDLSIEGQSITIRCKGSLRINGNIQADLHSRTLEVGKEGQIQGAIAADTVNVYGRVSGAIMGAKVMLHSSAEVEGDIHSEFLSVEHGATFDGRSRKVRDAAEIAPQLDGSVSASAPSASASAAASTSDRNAGPQPFGITAQDGSLVN